MRACLPVGSDFLGVFFGITILQRYVGLLDSGFLAQISHSFRKGEKIKCFGTLQIRHLKL